MEKRYQVFISSTSQDLQPARQEVSQALLRADCFPAGMELFPAADEEQFEFIKQIIDQSDYYIIISAGRYGSIHPETGISYTEMEYDYALETRKPIIRLLHKNPLETLPGSALEKTDLARSELQRFREKMASGTLVRYWENSWELGAEVAFGLRDAERRHPAKGWVRTDDLDITFASNPTRDYALSSLETIFRIFPIDRTVNFAEGLSLMKGILRSLKSKPIDEDELADEISLLLNMYFDISDIDLSVCRKFSTQTANTFGAVDLIETSDSGFVVTPNGQKVLRYLEAYEFIEGVKLT